MCENKIQTLIKCYEEQLEGLEITPQKFSIDRTLQDPEAGLNHASAMLSSIRELAESGDTKEAVQRLLFIQGILFANGVYTITEIKQHNIGESMT